MKKIVFLLICSLLLVSATKAQSDTLVIQTSSVCGTCKKAIERDLSFEKGIKSSSLDVETSKLTVIYDSKKTTPEKIRARISKIGYDADDVKREPKAFDKLPDCCKDPRGHH
jgi:hypothetical protein